MEGILYVPPERGTILGRAIWKPRYVMVGLLRDALRHQQAGASAANKHAPQAAPDLGSRLESMYLTIFKTKSDWEPIQQHAISSITDCQVQMVAHRKQGPVRPTLVINISPDPVTDKLRKRRSSRTAGFTSTKETSPTTLWFRPSDDNHNQSKHILQDWCHMIKSMYEHPGLISSASGPLGPLSPITPSSPTFTDPFATNSNAMARKPFDLAAHLKERQAEMAYRPASDHRSVHSSSMSHTTSSQTSQTNPYPPVTRERPVTLSESPSLRSRRSDLSHASSTVPPHIALSYNGAANESGGSFVMPPIQQRPAELPSPATTASEFQGDQFTEGWTPAQGRTSTVSSPIRARESISSAATAPPPSISSSSPPGPRETILDRAFQMQFIPGSGRAVPGEEKLSSLARFDALMREAELRKRQKQSQSAKIKAISPPRRARTEPSSGWDDDEEDEEDEETSEDGEEDEEGEDVDEDDGDTEGEEDSDDESRKRRTGDTIQMRGVRPLDLDIQIDPNTRRALDFIASRHEESKAEARRPRRSRRQASSPSSPSPSSSSSSALQSNVAASSRTMSSRTAASGRSGLGSGGSGGGSGGVGDVDVATPKTLDSGYSSSQFHLSSPPTSPFQGRLPSQAHQPSLQSEPTIIESSRMRPAVAQRTHSQTKVATMNHPTGASTAAPDSSNRQSTTSTKHLSFTEFTKRLSSSTSSLLLVQTNASSNSGAGSVVHIHDGDNTTMAAVTGAFPSNGRMIPPPPPPPAERCGWRGSVGVFSSTEGGFL